MQFKVTFRYHVIGYTLMIFTISSFCLAQNNMWETRENMPTARFALSASVADGIVYAIGGNAGSGTGTSIVEAYDPTINYWYTGLMNMPTPRLTFCTASVDGKIYAMGGRTTPQGGAIGTVEMYDPVSNTWDTTKSPMNIPRVLFGATAVNGKIYAIGGADFSAGLVFSTVEEYDPQTDMWTIKSPMPTPRHSFDIAAVNGKIYACGGDTTAGSGGVETTVAVEEYDPVTDTWDTTKADLPAPRSAFSACELNDKLYIISGSEAVFPHSPLTTSVLEYDPSTNTWTERAPIPTARALFAAVSFGECLYAIGGSSTSFPFTPTDAVEAYCPVTGIVDNLEENIVEILTLHENFPNPFNPTTTIAFDLSARGFVTLKIFDTAGHEVAVLASRQLEAGDHKVEWNASGVASGVYFYQLQVSNNQSVKFSETGKMILMK